MALTIALDPRARSAMPGLDVRMGTITFDDSYPTNGEPLTPGDLGFIEEVFALIVDAGVVTCKYDATNDKLLAYWCDYDAGADGLLIEVGNGTNLSTQGAIRFVAFGH